MNNKYIHITDDTKKECAQMYLSGYSIQNCSNHYKVSPTTISRWLIKLKVKIRDFSTAHTITSIGKEESDKRIKLNTNDLINEYKKGESLKEVAKTFGVTTMFVMKRFAESNFKVRSYSDANRLKCVSKTERKTTLFKIYGEPIASV